MCEQFKTDFVNKIEKALENDIIIKLEKHHNMTVKNCAFKDVNPLKCKQLFIGKPNENKGTKCVKCERFICEGCISTKSLANSQCVDCYVQDSLKQNPDFLKPICCGYCKSTSIYSYGHKKYVYCKGCNSLILLDHINLTNAIP